MRGRIPSVCDSKGIPHTKTGRCALKKDAIKGLIIHYENNGYPLDEEAFNAAMQEAIYTSDDQRIIPLIEDVSIIDNSLTGGDLTTNQEGIGPTVPIALGVRQMDYIIDGSVCLFKQLAKLNGVPVRIFEVDRKDYVFGTESIVNKENVFEGFSATIWARWRDALLSGQQGAIILSVFFSANYENEEKNMHAVKLTEVLEGLTGIELERTGSGTARVINSCSGEDITATFGEDLANPVLYVNSAGANPTGVTYADGILTFTPAAASYKIADASVFHANDIDGFEGEDIYTDLT